MSNLPARNRVIYQSEALFVSPDTTGHHVFYEPKFTGELNDCIVSGKDKDNELISFNACNGTVLNNGKDYSYATFDGTGLLTGSKGPSGFHPVLDLAGFKEVISNNDAADHLKITDPKTGSWGSAIEQLKRVQSANYSFTINRQDVNEFGQLGRIDSVVLEAPTVSLDFSYYLTDGENERLLGMTTHGQSQSLSGIMTRNQNDFGNNFFILTVPEGRDALGGDMLTKEKDKTVIGLGNGYITDYSIEASVGSFPTASVTVEGLNIKSDKGTQWKSIPAVDPENGTSICNRTFFMPPVASGDGTSILKPGDIVINLKDSALISKQISGQSLGYDSTDEGSAHVQSFSLSTPLGRTDLQRLGNTYSYAKEIDFPVTCSLTVNALVADLKSGNLVSLLCGKQYDIDIGVKAPKCIECDANNNDQNIVINFKGALLDSESFSSSIGDNKTVDLTFSTQIGGPEQSAVGVFFSGFENTTGMDGKFKDSPNIKSGVNGFNKYFKYGQNGTTGEFASGRY